MFSIELYFMRWKLHIYMKKNVFFYFNLSFGADWCISSYNPLCSRFIPPSSIIAMGASKFMFLQSIVLKVYFLIRSWRSVNITHRCTTFIYFWIKKEFEDVLMMLCFLVSYKILSEENGWRLAIFLLFCFPSSLITGFFFVI